MLILAEQLTQMPGSNYLIDTNIVIEVFSGDQEIADKINDLNGFSISSTILGELFVGVYRAANKTKLIFGLLPPPNNTN